MVFFLNLSALSSRGPVAIICACILQFSSSPFVHVYANDRSIQVKDIVELAEFSGISVCPLRNRIAIRTDRPSVASNLVLHNWTIVELSSGKTLVEADAGESIRTYHFNENIEPQWSADCEWLYFRARRESEVQIWQLNALTGRQKQITTDDADILDFRLIDDDRAIVFETDVARDAIVLAESSEYKRGTLIDETIYGWFGLVRTLPIRGEWRTLRMPSGFQIGHLLAQEPKNYKVLSLGNKRERPATKQEMDRFNQIRSGRPSWVGAKYQYAALMNSGSAAAVVVPVNIDATLASEASGGLAQQSILAKLSRENSFEPEICRDTLCKAPNIIPLSWSKDGHSVYFIVDHRYSPGQNGIYSWTPKTKEIRPVFEADGLIGALAGSSKYQSMPCPVIEEIAYCTISDRGGPPRLMSISLATGAAQIVFDPNRALRKRFALSTKRVQWTDKFDRTNIGILVFPRNYEHGVRYPLILTTYTCAGFLTGGVGDGGPEYVLAENGFAVLCLEYNRQQPPKSVTDSFSVGPGRYVVALAEYESAIDMLVRYGIADRERVGITGTSFSAQSISHALTHSRMFAAVSLRNLGVWEPSYRMFLQPGSAVTDIHFNDHQMGEGGLDWAQIYDELSLSKRAHRSLAPVLVQTHDSEYLSSLEAYTALRRANKPVEMHVFPDETHHLFWPVHRYVNFTRNVDWFRFWLQGYEDPDPEKTAQYQRWLKLKKLVVEFDTRGSIISEHTGKYY